jgi:hypothetical protein
MNDTVLHELHFFEKLNNDKTDSKMTAKGTEGAPPGLFLKNGSSENLFVAPLIKC